MNFASEYVYTRPKPIREADQSFEPDTNILSVKFDHLYDKPDMFVGDPIKCKKCDVYLSHISNVELPDALTRKRRWQCDFCGFENQLSIDENEIPKQEETNYILEGRMMSKKSVDTKYCVFCIDTSGSMSISSKVSADTKLPTDLIKSNRFIDTVTSVDGFRANEFELSYPNRSAEKYVSRLECLQLAIYDNINSLKKEGSLKRVGIVSFNNEVRVIGDGKIAEFNMKDSDLLDKEHIIKRAKETPKFTSIMADTDNKIIKKVLNLEEKGQTALGPALLYSIHLASEVKNSQVILCTDGLANLGLGSFESDDSAKFYDELGDFAVSKGVNVSVFTIEGTNCKLGVLGQMSNKTNGTIKIVNPLTLKDEFSSLIGDQVVATEVEITLVVHKSLYIKDAENIMNRENVIKKRIGNATRETEVTFEFGIRDDISTYDNLKEVPFQLSFVYNDFDDEFKGLRVLTKKVKVTNDKFLAEKKTDRKILAAHFVQKRSNLINQNQMSPQAKEVCNRQDVYLQNLKTSVADNFEVQNFQRYQAEMDTLEEEGEGECINYMNLSDEKAKVGFVTKKAAAKEFSKKNKK